MRTPRDQRSLRRLPALTRDAVGLVWRAAPRELATLVAFQVVAGLGLGGQLLLGREVIAAAIEADRHGGGLGPVLPQLIALIALTAVVGLVSSLQSDRVLLLGELVARQAQGAILDVASAVDYREFEDPSFHDGLERARYNAGARPTMMVNSLLGGLNAALGGLGLTVALFAIHPLLVPFAAAVLVPVWLVTTGNGKAYYDFSVAMTPRDRERTYLSNALTSKDFAAEVRVFQLAPFLRRRHEHLYEKRLGELRRVVRRRTRRSLAAGAVSFVLTALVIGFLLSLLLDHKLTLAATAVGLWGVALLVQRLRTAVSSAGVLYECALFIADVTEFLDRRADARQARPAAPAPDGFEQLRVDSVGFTYPGAARPALRDVTIEIGRGEVVALVGENGSGKTTLAKILAALYTPDSGAVLWDGIPAAAYDSHTLRRSIAVIFQDFAKYALSARDNVAVGRTEFSADLDRVVRAAETAGADEFLSQLPQGYETLLSRLFEGGRQLSIGQWQRVALARAFFRDARFVIMDEPTASLDPVSERNLFERIAVLSRDRALLLISHRFSSVRSADRIYVMHEGRIVEQGSHDALMELGGRYATLFRLQADAYLAKAPTPVAG